MNGISHTAKLLTIAVAACPALLWAAPVASVPVPANLQTGFVIEWVQVDVAPFGAGSPSSVAEAQAILDGTSGLTELGRVTQTSTFINYQDANVPFGGADPVFAVRVSGYITLGAGTYSFLSFHDDGLRVNVGGETVINFDANTPNVATDSPFYNLAAGVYSYEAISWEAGGAFNMQLGIDVNGTAADGRVFLAGQHQVPEPGTLALTALAMLAAGSRLKSRKKA